MSTVQLILIGILAPAVPDISENEWREFVDHLARDRNKKRENPCPTLAPIEWFVGVYA